VALQEIPLGDANDLLVAWGHYLGACRRPFGEQAWGLLVDGRPVAVAVSASIVSAQVSRYAPDPGDLVPVESWGRSELVELARLCAADRWATRVMVRLWREVAAPAWPYWPVTAAVAYSHNDRHEGRIYRFDGWERITARAGTSGGGGAWTRPRRQGDAARGAKTLWLWRYHVPVGHSAAATGATPHPVRLSSPHSPGADRHSADTQPTAAARPHPDAGGRS
jgi:hypothetical protein